MLNGVHLVGTNFSKGCCGKWVHQGVGKVLGGLHGGITGGRFCYRTLVQEKMDGFGCAFGAGLWNVDPVASLVFGSGTDVPAVYTMPCPSAAIGWGFKHVDLCSWGGQGEFD